MSVSIEVGIEWDSEKFGKIISRAKDCVALALKYTAECVWSEVRKRAPVDHGRLAGSFALEKIDDLAWRVFTNVHYALFVHEGTGIYGPEKHRIVPRRAKFLSFHWKKVGRHVRFRSVRGMPGRPYAEKSIEYAKSRTQEFAARAVRELFGGEAG